MNFNPEEREFYEDHLKWLRIETNILKKTREESLAEGKEKARKEGREKVLLSEKLGALKRVNRKLSKTC